MSYDMTIGQTTTAYAVTTSDSNTVSYSSLYVGYTGNVAVVPLKDGPSGTVVTFPNVPAGSHLKVAVCKVMNTGTTASGIVGYGNV